MVWAGASVSEYCTFVALEGENDLGASLRWLSSGGWASAEVNGRVYSVPQDSNTAQPWPDALVALATLRGPGGVDGGDGRPTAFEPIAIGFEIAFAPAPKPSITMQVTTTVTKKRATADRGAP
ncbi:MAG: hypothetical protein WB761_24065 [Solirubrobacteraceae bacterium]